MIYDVTYFINKFEAIPEDKWCTLAWTNHSGAHCANGHCGATRHDDANHETAALEKAFDMISVHNLLGDNLVNIWPGVSSIVAAINDGGTFEYQQTTPKARILAALYDIKKMQNKDIDTGGKKERIVYVSVPVSITEQSKDLVLS